MQVVMQVLVKSDAMLELLSSLLYLLYEQLAPLHVSPALVSASRAQNEHPPALARMPSCVPMLN